VVDSCRSGSPWVDESVQTRKGKVNKNVRRDANIYIGDKSVFLLVEQIKRMDLSGISMGR